MDLENISREIVVTHISIQLSDCQCGGPENYSEGVLGYSMFHCGLSGLLSTSLVQVRGSDQK